jgi:predicted nucleic acid-binding protein
VIVLDTNVLSELMRAEGSARVVAWLDAQVATSVFTTTITEAELFFGVALLPRGKRQQALERAAQALFDELEGRVLAFDSAAARAFAQVCAARTKRGRPIATADAQIAAITLSRGGRLATRNGADFEGLGLEVLNPWMSR